MFWIERMQLRNTNTTATYICHKYKKKNNDINYDNYNTMKTLFKKNKRDDRNVKIIIFIYGI